MKTLAIDFGGTRIKAGIIEDGNVLDSFTLPTPVNAGLADVLPSIKSALYERSAELRNDISALACALPALVNSKLCKVRRVFNKYNDSLDFPFEQWAKDELGLPLLIENDAKAAAVGEWKYGAGAGSDSMVMITLGTGIGTAVISNGDLLTGMRCVAGNMGGHTILIPDGRECVCGMKGCIEAYAASWAIDGIAKESELYSQSSLSNAPCVDYQRIFEQAELGDELALSLRERAFQYWSIIVINSVYQYGTDKIIIGGGIMESKDIILPAIRQKVDDALKSLHFKINIEASSSCDNSALRGLDYLTRVSH